MLTRTTSATQRGLSAFGALVVIAIAAAAGYYIYQSAMGEDTPPSCASTFQSCMKNCRRVSTDNESEQACQKKCEANSASCEALQRK
ncbi:MAG: hypothetical protein WCA09_13015 [Burkholderiales bacterium]